MMYNIELASFVVSMSVCCECRCQTALTLCWIQWIGLAEQNGYLVVLTLRSIRSWHRCLFVCSHTNNFLLLLLLLLFLVFHCHAHIKYGNTKRNSTSSQIVLHWFFSSTINMTKRYTTFFECCSSHFYPIWIGVNMVWMVFRLNLICWSSKFYVTRMRTFSVLKCQTFAAVV